MSSWDDDDSAAAAEAAATDVELLKRAWRNEKAAPEILRFDSPLVSRVREQIQLLVRFSLSVFLLDRVPPLHSTPSSCLDLLAASARVTLRLWI
jgi:GINS complex subunit 4